jgi:hypothetical protein
MDKRPFKPSRRKAKQAAYKSVKQTIQALRPYWNCFGGTKSESPVVTTECAPETILVELPNSPTPPKPESPRQVEAANPRKRDSAQMLDATPAPSSTRANEAEHRPRSKPKRVEGVPLPAPVPPELLLIPPPVWSDQDLRRPIASTSISTDKPLTKLADDNDKHANTTQTMDQTKKETSTPPQPITSSHR